MECLKCPNYWNGATQCEMCNNKTFAEWYIKTFGKMPPLIIGKEDR